MATKAYFMNEEIGIGKPGFTKTRAVIEAAFYGTNVIKVNSLEEAYELVKDSSHHIVTECCAISRRVVGEPEIDTDDLDKKVLDAIYDTRLKPMYHAEVFIGLNEEFMVRAHILIPVGEEDILYSWMLHFQNQSEEYTRIYDSSRQIGNEPDIYLFSNPAWKDTDYPLGLAYNNTLNNIVCLLGTRCPGEHTKETISITLAIANRNGYVSCHGSQREYILANNKSYIASIIGLSGSGKSAIAYMNHSNKYRVTLLHGDVFIINQNTAFSTALVKEEISNKQSYKNTSPLWHSNCVAKITKPVNAILWVIRDSIFPPIIKITNASLAAVMGATLATKRSSAQSLTFNKDSDALVIEPYANPYRIYPLKNDYLRFRQLFADANVDCYVLNTGDFLGKKVQNKDTLTVIEDVVEGKRIFKQWGPFHNLEIIDWDGFVPDLNDPTYVSTLKSKINDRIAFIKSRQVYKGGYDALPDDALEALENIISELNE